ncbi:hypothetical protein NL676_004899 [Syzygium grande]|nr:hypothetical protein NL676_004899 [Syzygium grande]
MKKPKFEISKTQDRRTICNRIRIRDTQLSCAVVNRSRFASGDIRDRALGVVGTHIGYGIGDRPSKFEAKMERLYEAAVEGDVDSLLGLLEDDPLILDKCIMWSYNGSPLHIAALLGHERFVDEILDRKPELAGEVDAQEISPLHFATAKGYLGIAKKLLTVNADMCYAYDIYGRSPLHIAVVKGQVDVLKELVRESPHAARQKMGHGETILHLCVEHNNLEALKVLVESVGDHEFVNLKNDHGDTILHLAAAYKQTETISFLTSCTAVEVNSLNADSLTAHELLARSGKSGTRMDNTHNLFEAGGSTEIVHALSRSEMEFMTMRALPPYANDQNITLPVQRKGGFWQDTTQGDSSTKPHTAGYSIMADNDAHQDFPTASLPVIVVGDFYGYSCSKEAYVIAIGSGLACGLDRVESRRTGLLRLQGPMEFRGGVMCGLKQPDEIKILRIDQIHHVLSEGANGGHFLWPPCAMNS